jgi:hypothetical protein
MKLATEINNIDLSRRNFEGANNIIRGELADAHDLVRISDAPEHPIPGPTLPASESFRMGEKRQIHDRKGVFGMGWRVDQAIHRGMKQVGIPMAQLGGGYKLCPE